MRRVDSEKEMSTSDKISKHNMHWVTKRALAVEEIDRIEREELFQKNRIGNCLDQI